MRLADVFPNVEPAEIDWPTFKSQIIQALDLVEEYKALGLRVESGPYNGKAQARAMGRADDNPSAFINLETGRYYASGAPPESLGFFDFALKYGQFGDWAEAIKFYAGRAGFQAPRIKKNSKGMVEEARYAYRDRDGEPLFEVLRFRQPNGKKTFRQRQPDGRGGWINSLDGVTRCLYRLPELVRRADQPVYFVEGEKDADTLASLGLVATTSPQGAVDAGRKYWTAGLYAPDLAGRDVIVIADNDQVGRAFAQLVAGLVLPTAASVKLLELPELPPKGDVSDWIEQGHTKAELLELVAAAPLYDPAKVIAEPAPELPLQSRKQPTEAAKPEPEPGPEPELKLIPVKAEMPDDPHRLARSFLKACYEHRDRATLACWNEEWHAWRNGTWFPRSNLEINAEITAHAKAQFDAAASRGKVAKEVGTRLIGNIANALRSMVMIPMHEVPTQPAWVDGQGPSTAECLATTTGIVHLPTYMDKGPEHPGAIIPPTPRFFSPNNLGYPFDLNAPSPEGWLSFLTSVWGDDQQSINCLQEWFGYLLTADTSLEKMLLIVGPKRSGKGTICRTIRALVGANNVTAPTLSALATPFGCQGLIGKTVAMIPESRLTGRSDSQAIVERLLSISGEDAQSIPRKHIGDWHGTLRCRFILLGNELPRLGDYSGALPGRMIVLKMTRSFFGEEDTSLESRIASELPGILLWALEGWERLRERGRFNQPKTGAEMLEEFETLTNPIGAFIADRCEIGPDHSVTAKDLYEEWKEWSEENGRDKKHVSDVQGFSRMLRATVSTITMDRPRDSSGGRFRRFVGIAIREKIDAF